MTIKLYELLGHEDRRYSQFSWRAKMALKHKGLEFEQIPLLLTDKDSIAFANAKSVPVMVDGDVVKTDSWDIAVYLDETYADAPSLLGGAIGQGVTRVINSWCDRAVNIALGPLIARDVLDAAHPDDRDYFRESMEKMYKRTLEEVQEGREDRVINLYRTMDPIRTSFRRGQGFICGDSAGYADYAVFSQFQWARITSPFQLLAKDDPVYAWRERMLDLHGGFARDTACYEVSGREN
ncbi:MAG: glutathione S-transferase N-terminal domain-containing protein [Pseudomonadota bacterium]|nr:glutathione S-transferase N-terminal domain-containing protein [Pseudomonadota bacterium]